MALKEDFEAAAKNVQTLPSKPGNDVLLQLYGLYKQGSVGDVQGKRPGMTDFKGRAKYDAWAKLKGTGTDAAQQQYIDLVTRLKG